MHSSNSCGHLQCIWKKKQPFFRPKFFTPGNRTHSVPIHYTAYVHNVHVHVESGQHEACIKFCECCPRCELNCNPKQKTNVHAFTTANTDLSLKILRDDSACPGACQVIQWVKGCFDALDKKYVCAYHNNYCTSTFTYLFCWKLLGKGLYECGLYISKVASL